MRFFWICLSVLVFAAAAFAINCFECDSMDDPRCNANLQYCNYGVKQADCEFATGCLTKIHEGVDGQKYFYRRACYFGNPENTDEMCAAKDRYLPWAELVDCIVCHEDLCNTNAATSHSGVSIALLLTMLLSRALLFLK